MLGSQVVTTDDAITTPRMTASAAQGGRRARYSQPGCEAESCTTLNATQSPRIDAGQRLRSA